MTEQEIGLKKIGGGKTLDDIMKSLTTDKANLQASMKQLLNALEGATANLYEAEGRLTIANAVASETSLENRHELLVAAQEEFDETKAMRDSIVSTLDEGAKRMKRMGAAELYLKELMAQDQ